ncbi:TPA: hypothetical protein DIV48_03060 [Candidatus Kaiserbacteria bacterium]|nr:hypothetical protein [Candidatus Kaiserbacteria bacterium]
MANDALLQKPLNLSAVHGITREPINLPANNPLRLTLLYPRHHIAEYRTARHLRRAFFYEYLNDVELFALCKGTKLGVPAFNGQHLLVLNIGAFAGV